MAVTMSTSIGLPLRKLNWANNGCHRCERLPRKPFTCLRFFRMFKTGKIVFLAKGLLPSETTFMTFGTKGTLHARHQWRLVMVDCPLEFCLYTVAPRYNTVVGFHDIGPRCKRGALGVPISATRELLNNSDRRPLHQVHERCRSPMLCAGSTVLYANMQFMELIKLYASINVYYF